MIDYIKAAVELADNFELDSINAYYWHDPSYGEGFDGIAVDKGKPDRWFLDSLAAQLVRQVDALDEDYVVTVGNEMEPKRVVLYGPTFRMWRGRRIDGDTDGPDRTMNTIKAIVDSGVLK